MTSPLQSHPISIKSRAYKRLINNEITLQLLGMFQRLRVLPMKQGQRPVRFFMVNTLLRKQLKGTIMENRKHVLQHP